MSLKESVKPQIRINKIRKFVNKNNLGLEIGPYHSPICPKSEGYNCLSLDVFNRDELLKNYSNLLELYGEGTFSLACVDAIEEVDIVTTDPLALALETYAKKEGSRILTFIDSLDYIISSHSFEHQPNPIRFLQDVARCLRAKGTLSMAIPIASRCFDCFQSLSSTGQFIDAYQQNNQKPSLGQAFDHRANFATLSDGTWLNDLNYAYNNISLNSFNGELSPERFELLKAEVADNYLDLHCWRFTPFSFELIFLDLKACGFFPSLELKEIEVLGSEFFIHFCKESSVDHLSLATPQNRTRIYKNSIEFQWNDLKTGFEAPLKVQLAAAQLEIQKLSEKNNQLEAQVIALLNSLSWKLAMPFRKCKNLFLSFTRLIGHQH